MRNMSYQLKWQDTEDGFFGVFLESFSCYWKSQGRIPATRPCLDNEDPPSAQPCDGQWGFSDGFLIT
jgi:hypothetical protein